MIISLHITHILKVRWMNFDVPCKLLSSEEKLEKGGGEKKIARWAIGNPDSACY